MFKVDDGFYDHPKVKSLPRGPVRDAAVGLWTYAGTWCARYLMDGMLPAIQIEELGSKIKSAEALVAARLWHPGEFECWSEKPCPTVPAGHFLFHQWDVYQDLKSDVELRREKARIRMAQVRNGERSDNARS